MRRPGWLNRDALAARVVGYLGLALLPIGMISVVQARTTLHAEQEQAELALVALTEQAVVPLALEINRVVGATESLALSNDLLLQPDACDDAVARFAEGDGPFDYVRFVAAGAAPICSAGVAPSYILTDLTPEPGTRLRVDILPSSADARAIGVGLALSTDGQDPSASHLYTIKELPAALLPHVEVGRRGLPYLLVSFTGDGQPLTWDASGSMGEAAERFLPAGVSLAELAQGRSRFFVADSVSGASLSYAVVPVSADLVYALSVWDPAQSGRPVGFTAQAPLAFPALLWSISLGVAVWSLGRLVVKPVRELARRMNLFGSDRTLVEEPLAGDLTRELREIDGVFRDMAGSVVRDERRMRLALEERSALLREVHHRVKNNLQLISSIVSMQLRRADDPEVKAMLRRLQDRVLTLAAIYRALYTSADMTDVNVAPILRQIIEREVDAHASEVSPKVEIDDLRLDADKVVPLVFLAAEAVSNATAAAPPGEGALTVRLRRLTDGRATLDVENDLQGDAPAERRRGLGAQLMAAFAAQIGAPVQSGVADGIYRVSITFDVDGTATVAEEDRAPEPIPAS